MSITLNASTVTNRDWKTRFEFSDGDTGLLIDFSTAFIAIAIEDKDGCQKILATTTNGKITVIELGIIELDISHSEMNLCAGTYQIGGYYQLNGDTIDLFEGSLTLRKGIPTP